MIDDTALGQMLKKLIEIEDRLSRLEGKTTTTINSSSGRAVFHSLNIREEDHSNNAKSLDKVLQNSADLIIEHYRRQPPKRL